MKALASTVTTMAKDSAWWRSAVVYQIYPRSFGDGNGDGIGDLGGVLGHVDHLARLGIDAVWLSPIYPSALVDGGYDIDDHRAVDSVFGTLGQFRQLVDDLHGHGIKVVLDIVPNHSSNRHRWFQEALAAPSGSLERARYHFRDGLGPDGDEPPADWLSFFGGSAWTRVADGQWYLHSFTEEQPDWNWDNTEVRADFLETLRFWGDLDVDGFRVDVAFLLAKDLEVDLPSWAEMMSSLDPGAVDPRYPVGQHPIWDRDELDDIYREWRTVFDSYDPPLSAVAEAWVSPDRRVRYASPDGLGQAFNFDLLQAGWDRTQFRDIIEENLVLAGRSGTSSTWVLSNHDVPRHATRFGLADTTPTAWLLAGGSPDAEDRELGLRRARAATLLMLALPGSAYLFQGEELGLPEVGDLPDEWRQDPVFFRSGGADKGRDGARVPLPWSADPPSFGFSSGLPHLPQPAWFAAYAVEVQERDPHSTLSLYRRALALRRELLHGEDLTWLDLGADLLGFRRTEQWSSITNFGAAPAVLPAGTVLLASAVLPDATVLPPGVSAWMHLADADEVSS